MFRNVLEKEWFFFFKGAYGRVEISPNEDALRKRRNKKRPLYKFIYIYTHCIAKGWELEGITQIAWHLSWHRDLPFLFFGFFFFSLASIYFCEVMNIQRGLQISRILEKYEKEAWFQGIDC